MNFLKNGMKIHFLGIGGISMSGLAEILKNKGFLVRGSDQRNSETTKRLMELGIEVFFPNSEENISEEIDLVVYTAAVRHDNPEYMEAKKRGIPLLERAELLKHMLDSYKNTICISGTHGKTSTTNMLSDVLCVLGHDPTVSLGGHMVSNGMNYRVGGGGFFLLEACEYNNSFLHWSPFVGVILNLEYDHPDTYKNLDDVVSSFSKFAKNVLPSGFLVVNKAIPEFCVLVKNTRANVVTFGPENTGARFWPKNIECQKGFTRFDIMEDVSCVARAELPLPGTVNVMNALACFAVCRTLGIAPDLAAKALGSVQGTKRRFEFKGSHGGISVYDDYAHHPTEIKASLRAFREFVRPKGRVICIFQPHTYSRTKHLLRDFACSFDDADIVVLLPIFAARENFDATVSSEMLGRGILENGTCARNFEKFDKAGNFVIEEAKKGDVVITLGAGEVYKIGDSLIEHKFSTLSTELL